MEQTLVLVKPDGVQRGLIGPIIARLEQRGLKLVGLKLMQMSAELAGAHYAEHQGKDFYPQLIAFITSGPVVAMVWQGGDAIAAVRQSMGATRPVDSPPGSIRGDFGLEVGRNLVHGSANAGSALREVSLFFSAGELVEWRRDAERWISE
ncbi:MAG: nucleoside-diphosphate kinase [Candidatus Promineifilaceae bacterium]